ncbi:hypothetical protein CY35_16G038800 [Sphagnum magellanicum]|nr:hypothetical protein CY35_16G038800 [Sphagnum magellanicum]
MEFTMESISNPQECNITPVHIYRYIREQCWLHSLLHMDMTIWTNGEKSYHF